MASHDTDEYGLSQRTRKSLNIKRHIDKPRKTISKSSKNLYGDEHVNRFSESLRERSYVLEKREFVTKGKEGKGKYDYVGKVMEVFFKAIPEFGRSEVERKTVANRWNVSGYYPSSGKHQFDWEIEAEGVTGGDVYLKIRLIDSNGKMHGIPYMNVNVATAHRAVLHFQRWFKTTKDHILDNKKPEFKYMVNM